VLACVATGADVLSTSVVVVEVETGEAIVKTDIRFPFVTRRVEQSVIGAALK
jgi:hypothetical protein